MDLDTPLSQKIQRDQTLLPPPKPPNSINLNFRLAKAKMNKMVVWVQMPELPVEYYDTNVLYKIVVKIG